MTGKRLVSHPPTKRVGAMISGTVRESVSVWSLRKTVEQAVLDTFFSDLMEKVIGNSQHRLTKGKSCVTNLSAF